MRRHSYRVSFPGGSGHLLAGIIDSPVAQADRNDTSPVLVLSHCFTCNKDLKAIVRISRALSQAGISVLRYDMTGLGGSEGDFSYTNFTTQCADLQAAIDFANRSIGPVRILMGHSFGGAASLQVASEQIANQDAQPGETKTNRLASLTGLVTLAAPSDTVHLSELLAKRDPRIDQEGIGSVNIGGRDWTIRREMLDDFRAQTLQDRLPAIQVPTLVFHSPVDETVHFDHGIRIKSLIGNDASLVSLPGADHLLAKNPLDLEYVANATAAFVHRWVT